MKYFEQRLDEENLKSKRVAWTAFAAMTLIAAGLTVTLVRLMPLKRTEVKVLVVDKNTGLPSEITALSDFESGNVREMTASEALNKYFANQYIIAHDAYNHYAVREAYATVQLYSTPQVFEDYAKKFRGANNIEQQLGTDKVLEINVVSITPQNIPTPFKDGDNGVTMQARVEKQIRQGEQILSKTSGIVTMTFGYDADLTMDESARNRNPFGFTVTSYRFDPDMGGQ